MGSILNTFTDKPSSQLCHPLSHAMELRVEQIFYNQIELQHQFLNLQQQLVSILFPIFTPLKLSTKVRFS